MKKESVALGSLPVGATFTHRSEPYTVVERVLGGGGRVHEVVVENLDFGYEDIFRADLVVAR